MKMSIAASNRRHSDESKRKMSAARKGMRLSEQCREKLSQLNHGDLNGNAKLTWAQVELIRELLEQKVPQKDIAKRFKVDCSTVWSIKHNKSWVRR